MHIGARVLTGGGPGPTYWPRGNVAEVVLLPVCERRRDKVLQLCGESSGGVRPKDNSGDAIGDLLERLPGLFSSPPHQILESERL